jgi:hypothetical protein
MAVARKLAVILHRMWTRLVQQATNHRVAAFPHASSLVDLAGLLAPRVMLK